MFYMEYAFIILVLMLSVSLNQNILLIHKGYALCKEFHWNLTYRLREYQHVAFIKFYLFYEHAKYKIL